MRGFCWLMAGLGLSVLSAGGQTARPTLPANRLEHYSDPGPRHWRGTVGRQTVTMELDSGRGGCYGRYHYDQRGRTLYLSQASAESQKANLSAGQTQLNEAVDWQSTGYFIFNGPLRSQFSGSWHSPDGRCTLPVALHETYADALAYEEESWYLDRFVLLHDDFNDRNRLDSADVNQHYLRLRPPFTAATRRLRDALGPPVAPSRMGHYLDSLARTRQESQPDYFFHGHKYVVYNSNHLLSVVHFEQFIAAEGEDMGMHEWGQSRTYDLRTGRRLQLAEILKPGYEPQLRRWLLQRMKSMWESTYYNGVGADGKLPIGGFLVTGTGLSFSYDDRDDESLGFPGPYHADRSVNVEIPYETLLPILRPDGPLRALLLERKVLPRP